MSPCDHFVKNSNILYILKLINVRWLQRIDFYVFLCPNRTHIGIQRVFLEIFSEVIFWFIVVAGFFYKVSSIFERTRLKISRNTHWIPVCDRTLLRKMLFRSFVAYRRTPLMLESNPPCQQYFFESGSCMKKEHCVIRHSLIFKGIFPKTDQRCPLLYTWESIGPTVNVVRIQNPLRFSSKHVYCLVAPDGFNT